MEMSLYSDIRQMSSAAALLIRSALIAGLRQDAAVSLALPGGTTPLQMLEQLAALDGIPWRRIALFPVDEHLRASHSPPENGARLERLFAPLGARVATLLPTGTEMGDYRAAGDAAEARLRSVPWPPAVACLGMGEDGHTASLLPGPDFADAMSCDSGRRFVGLRPDPMPASAAFDRITITAAALGSARLMMVLISGREKRRVLEQALSETRSGKAALPIGQAIALTRSPVKVLWCP
jgi:6-phosphogluconolactonase